MTEAVKYLIPDTNSIRDTMIRLNDLGIANAVVFVVNTQNQLLGSVSDGDIRRSLINGSEMKDQVTKIMNRGCIYSVGERPDKEIIRSCRQKRIRFLPLLNDNKEVLKIQDVEQVLGIVPVDAVLMAGGEGKRLKPLTDNLPKPLLPIGGKPIIEHNIDRLVKYGIVNIRISINYLGHKLKEYFEDGDSKNIKIEYIQEDKPLGTVGAVTLVNDWRTEHVLIMNSDLLTDVDYADFYESFLESKADLTVASVPYLVNVPYAVLDTSEDNQVKGLLEKPNYTYYSNAGIYLLHKKLLRLIPQNSYFDMPDLIEYLIQNGHKVTSYPIRGYWLDIGKMNDYVKAQEDIRHLKL